MNVDLTQLGVSQKEIVAWLLKAGSAAAILVVGVVLARLLRGWILRLGTRNRMAINVATLLANLAQVGILVLAVVLILPTFGVDWTGLLTLVGAVGLAVSLAFQDLLRNFIAGIYLLIERPFTIGDLIAIGPEEKVVGTVQAIALRTTSLRTVDGLLVIVPNNTVFGDIVTNRSAIDLRRHVLSVCLTQGDATLPNISSRITEALSAVDGVAGTPPPATRVESISPHLLMLHVEFWTPPATGDSVAGEVALALRGALPEADVTVVS